MYEIFSALGFVDQGFTIIAMCFCFQVRCYIFVLSTVCTFRLYFENKMLTDYLAEQAVFISWNCKRDWHKTKSNFFAKYFAAKITLYKILNLNHFWDFQVTCYVCFYVNEYLSMYIYRGCTHCLPVLSFHNKFAVKKHLVCNTNTSKEHSALLKIMCHPCKQNGCTVDLHC